MSTASVVTKSTELLKAVKALAPPLSFDTHKGQAGRVGIIGGSLEYTGAPYFSAITVLKAGGDLSHIFCPDKAANVIKSYSPDLIVHPILSENSEISCTAISQWLPRLHSLVIGPGLGRDPGIISTVKLVIICAKSQEKDIIIDADGLHIVLEDPSLIIGYKRAILSPNMIEFNRLFEKMTGQTTGTMNCSDIEQTQLLAKQLGGVTILRKGQTDIITNGDATLVCDEIGSPTRKGGQGDLLSGSIGLYIYWARTSVSSRLAGANILPISLIASYAGCLLVKRCAKKSYAKLGRSVLASDLIVELPETVKELFD